MTSHRIRLPAPWRVTHSPEAVTVIFRRSFHRPTGIDGDSVIRLEVTLLEPLSFHVALNGSAYPVEPRGELVFEAALDALKLDAVNELEITVVAPASLASMMLSTGQPQFGRDYIAKAELLLG